MGRAVAIVFGVGVLAGAIATLKYRPPPYHWMEAAFLSVFGIFALGFAVMPKDEQGGAAAEWDTGPYSSALKLVLLVLMAFVFASAAWFAPGGWKFLMAPIAIACVWGMLRPLRRLRTYFRFGNIELRLDGVPEGAVRRLAGRIVFGATREAPKELSVSLVCNDVMIVGQRRHRMITSTERWKETRLLPVKRVGSKETVAFAFDVPDQLPRPMKPSEPGDSGLPDEMYPDTVYNQWQVVVEGGVERAFVLPAEQ